MLLFLARKITVTEIMTAAPMSIAKASMPKSLPRAVLLSIVVGGVFVVTVILSGLGSSTTTEFPPNLSVVTGAERFAPSMVEETRYFDPGVSP